MDQSINQSISSSDDQSLMNEWINGSINQSPLTQATHQWINQSINQTIDQYENGWMKRAINGLSAQYLAVKVTSCNDSAIWSTESCRGEISARHAIIFDAFRLRTGNMMVGKTSCSLRNISTVKSLRKEQCRELSRRKMPVYSVMSFCDGKLSLQQKPHKIWPNTELLYPGYPPPPNMTQYRAASSTLLPPPPNMTQYRAASSTLKTNNKEPKIRNRKNSFQKKFFISLHAVLINTKKILKMN